MLPSRRRSRAHALRLDVPSLAEGGLAFLLAYVVAYAVSAI